MILVVLQLISNALFRDEGQRLAPYAIMLVLMVVAGCHALWWHFTTSEAALFPALHYVALALGGYVAISAYAHHDGGNLTNLVEVARYFFWIIGYLFFYATARSNSLAERHVKMLLLMALPVVLLTLRQEVLADQELRQGATYSSASVGYVCLSLMLWALLLKRSTFQEVAIVLCAFGVMISLKRGAMLAMIVAGIATYLFSARGRARFSPRRTLAMAVVVIVAVLAIHIRWDGMAYRMNKGNADRQMLWEDYLNLLNNATPEAWWFGHGAMATKHICTSRAHCDWIEIWFNFGFVGVLLLAAMFLLLTKGCIESLLRREHASAAFCFGFVVFVLTSLYSGMLSTPAFFMYSTVFGLAHGRHGRAPGFDHDDCRLAGLDTSGGIRGVTVPESIRQARSGPTQGALR